VDQHLPPGIRAQRHRLLGDVRRLAIVEALEEGPRQVPELARLLGIHPTTVRAHLERLLEAGVLQEEPGIPAGRGRPSKRYRLRHPLLGGDTEVRLFVGSLVSLLHGAYGDRAVATAEEEGARRGRELGRSFRHPSIEQAVQEVVETLKRLSFAPAPPTRQKDVVAVNVRHCPFSVDPDDPNGAIVCAFHEGLVRGVAEVASGEKIGVRLMPFIAPGLCRVELSFRKPGTPERRGRVKIHPEDVGAERKPRAPQPAPGRRRTETSRHRPDDATGKTR
jgi:predicted ArsR family transcriptional regulator